MTIPASDDSFRVPACAALRLRLPCASQPPPRSLVAACLSSWRVSQPSFSFPARERGGVAHHCALWPSTVAAGVLRVVTWLLLARGEAPQQADVSAVDQHPGARCRNLALFGAQPPHGRVPRACSRLLARLVGRLVRVLSFLPRCCRRAALTDNSYDTWNLLSFLFFRTVATLGACWKGGRQQRRREATQLSSLAGIVTRVSSNAGIVTRVSSHAAVVSDDTWGRRYPG